MKLNHAYNNFFNKSEEGQYFIKWLKIQIDEEHQKAETEPSIAGFHTSKASGYREVLTHIQGVMSQK